MELNHKKPIWTKRIINYIIDSIVIIILFLAFISFLLPILLKSIKSEFVFDINIILVIIYFLYYFVFETLTRRTVGKFFTKTIVVSVTNKKPSIGQFLVRTLLRFMFIEVISYFTHRPVGWHDRLSNTVVIEI
jgi:uncharacterized RDD family membrane protein YckC